MREQSVGEALAVFCADAEQLASEVIVHRAAGFDAIAQVEVVTAAMLWAQALMHLGLLRPCITRCVLLVLALALLVCCGVSLRTTPLADHGSDAGRFFFVAESLEVSKYDLTSKSFTLSSRSKVVIQNRKNVAFSGILFADLPTPASTDDFVSPALKLRIEDEMLALEIENYFGV